MAQNSDNQCTTGWMEEDEDLLHYSIGDVGDLIDKFTQKIKKYPNNVKSVDLASNGGGFECIGIENQGGLNSCTAHTTVGLLQYFQQVTKGTHNKFSRLFLYKTTLLLQEKRLRQEVQQLKEKERLSDKEQDSLKKRQGWLKKVKTKCNVGVRLHNALDAMRLAGVPLEGDYLYDDENANKCGGVWNRKPSCDDYDASILKDKGITYYSLIDDGILKAKKSGEALLDRAKKSLRNGIPFMFGFHVYGDIKSGIDCGYGVKKKGCYPYRGDEEERKDGHAVIAVGYDDEFNIDGYKGALRIRNSYGDGKKKGEKGWGDNGYGWLSYEYILSGFVKKRAVNGFFCLIDAKFSDTNPPSP